MMKIAITGGIGSGKSIISALLSVLGYSVYDTDKRAKQLMEGSSEIRNKLIESFGEHIYVYGKLNRSVLASLIFNSKENLEKVNSVVHPVVKADFRKWCEKHESEPLLFMESAILFDSGFENQVNQVWVVSAPEELRIERAIGRDNCHRDKVLQRIKNQMDEVKRVALADEVIINDDRRPVLPQVLKLLNQIEKNH